MTRSHHRNQTGKAETGCIDPQSRYERDSEPAGSHLRYRKDQRKSRNRGSLWRACGERNPCRRREEPLERRQSGENRPPCRRRRCPGRSDQRQCSSWGNRRRKHGIPGESHPESQQRRQSAGPMDRHDRRRRHEQSHRWECSIRGLYCDQCD